MFKYSLILIIITSRIILKIIYMCLEFQMEHNICMPRLIYDLVNLLLFYIFNAWWIFCNILLCQCAMIYTFPSICLYSEWLLSNVISDCTYNGVNLLEFYKTLFVNVNKTKCNSGISRKADTRWVVALLCWENYIFYN